jgi:hypothetical protein
MQALWSRAARSNCTCRCLLCLNAARNGLARRASTAAGLRQIKLKDTIIAAYATIFIGGIIADKRRKDGKREEWDRKIAEVLEEVDVLRKRNDERTVLEDRPLASAIKKGISTRTQVPGQRRMYSTAQNAPVVDKTEDANPDPVKDEVNDKAPSNEDDLETEPSGSHYISPLALQAVRTLSVQRLALKLILRPGVIQSYGQPDFYRIGPRVPVTELEGIFGQNASKNVQQLLRKLSDTRRDLHLAQTGRMSEERLQEIANPSSPESEEVLNLLRSERRVLDDELSTFFRDFFLGRMELGELLFKIATNLLQSPATPHAPTYEILAGGFSKAMQQDLFRSVLDSLRESRYRLSSRMIRTTLLCYIRAKDLFSFNNFIKWLRGKVDYRGYLEPWKTIVVGGREVGVPPLQDGKILSLLIYGALSFDQPHRAEMWLAVLRRYGKDESPYIWSSYLRYYSLTSNWDEGQQVLSKAYNYLQSTSFEPKTRSVDSVWMVFWMLHLCLTCKQFPVYRRVLNLAVEKGLENTFMERERYKPSQEARTIALDWLDARVARHGKGREDGFQYPEATQSDLVDDLEFPAQETDEIEFSPKVKPVFNLLDGKAAFDARTAVLKSYTTSMEPRSKPSDGAILKYSKLGFTKEDLGSDLIWNGLSNDSTILDGSSTDISPSPPQPPLGTKEGEAMTTDDWEFEPPSTESEHQQDLSESSPPTQSPPFDNRPPTYSAQELAEEATFAPFIDQSSPLSTLFAPQSNPSRANLTPQQNLQHLLLRRLSLMDTLSELSECISTLSLDVHAIKLAVKTRSPIPKARMRGNRKPEVEGPIPHPPDPIRKSTYSYDMTIRRYAPGPEKETPFPAYKSFSPSYKETAPVTEGQENHKPTSAIPSATATATQPLTTEQQQYSPPPAHQDDSTITSLEPAPTSTPTPAPPLSSSPRRNHTVKRLTAFSAREPTRFSWAASSPGLRTRVPAVASHAAAGEE